MEAMWHGAFWRTNVVTCVKSGSFELSQPTLEEYLRKTVELYKSCLVCD